MARASSPSPSWSTDLGASPRIGLISMGGAGFTTLFDWIRVSRVR
jgi:arabinan endo-1,5-alpha-L-arabinosidase